MSKFDDLLETGASFDWITPTLSILSGNQVIAVPRDDQNNAKAILGGAGIKVHHEQIMDGQYVFAVERDDFDLAVSVLGGERKEGSSPALWFWICVLIAFVAAVIAAVGSVP